MYHYKGKKLRESIPNVTPENEVEMLKKLKGDIDAEVAIMTPQRGRQLLSKAGIILFLGWDLSASFIFDNLLHSDRKDVKLDIQGFDDILLDQDMIQMKRKCCFGPYTPQIKDPRL